MSLTVNALTRDYQGKGASRRLRRNHKIPAIVYGTGTTPSNITLDVFEITHLLENEESYTSVLDLMVDKKKEAVIIKGLQRHPATNIITHVDFLRINLKQAIVTSIPLHFNGEENNEAMRIGAILNKFVTSVEVSCLPTDLPHAIDVDISNLTMGEHISLTGLNMPKDVVITALIHGDIEAHDQSVVAIQEPRKMAEIKEEAPIIAEGENTENSDADKDKSYS